MMKRKIMLTKSLFIKGFLLSAKRIRYRFYEVENDEIKFFDMDVTRLESRSLSSTCTFMCEHHPIS